MDVPYFLQEGPDSELSWLFYVLIAFMALVILSGILASLIHHRQVQGQEADLEPQVKPSLPKTKSRRKPGKTPSRKKAK